MTPAKIVGNDSKLCVVDAQWHDQAQWLIDRNIDSTFMDKDLLYTLKVSHAHWNIHWDKTMVDIAFLQQRGCTLDEEAYSSLIVTWKQIHGSKKVNLNKPNDEFFADVVTRIFDHESLHSLVAFNGTPMNERIRPDLTRAWCDIELFNALSAEEKAQTALEEILVVAIERGKLTTASKLSDLLKAVKRSHFLLCTTMATGWFARYLIENHFNLIITRRAQWMSKLTTVLKSLPN